MEIIRQKGFLLTEIEGENISAGSATFKSKEKKSQNEVFSRSGGGAE